MNVTDSAFDLLRMHMVGLSVHTDADGPNGIKLPDGSRRTVLCSFVFSYGEHWVLITAGHIIEQMNAIVNEGHQLKLKLVTFDGNAAHPQIAISYHPTLTFHTDDDVLDFGFIDISPQTKLKLEENGIKPVDERHWLHEPDDEKYQKCTVIGLPQDNISNHGVSCGQRTISAGLTMMRIEHLFNVPPKLSKPLGWYGRLPIEDYRNLPFSANGLSGGIVAGFTRKDDGGIWYHVFALQHHAVECDGHYYLRATPLYAVGKYLEVFRDKLGNSPEKLAATASSVVKSATPRNE